MKLEIKQTANWNVPAGHYRATLNNIIGTKKRVEEVRFIFTVHDPKAPRRQYVAGITFEADLEPGSELREFLRSWRGTDFTEEEEEEGNFDMESLIGNDADVEIAHIKNKRYANPYVLIQSIHPPGTLVKDPAQQTDSPFELKKAA